MTHAVSSTLKVRATLLLIAAIVPLLGKATTVDYLVIDPQDSNGEGGELVLRGTGGYSNIQIDNYYGNARIFTLGTGKQLQVLGGTISANGTGGSNFFAGSMGIGTAATSSKVEILDGSGTGAGVLIQAGYPFGAGTYPSILKLKDKDSLYELFNVNSDGSFFFNRGPYRVITGAATGYVGIGTSSPSKRLHVYGEGQATSSGIADAGNQGASLYLQDTGGTPYNGGALIFGAGPGAFAGIKGEITDGNGNTVGDLSFQTRNTITDASLTPRLLIKNNGNVGIGTANVSHKLTVNGTIRAKEVIVDSGWADYVFADDYRLAPLAEVEAHIKEHKHLPGVPSASEVAEKGVSMGEMQATMMAKIEELTLHVIAQGKEIQGQKQTLKAQQEEIVALRAELVRGSH